MEHRPVRRLGVLLSMLFVGAWATWLVGSRVPVYAVSASARLELDRAAHPVSAAVAGRVVSTTLRSGADVAEGDVLVELDVRTQNLEMAVERTRLGGIAPQLERLSVEVAARESLRRETSAAAEAIRAEAASRWSEAVAAADLAADQEARTSKLAESKLVAEADVTSARSELKQRRAAAETLRLAVERADADRRQRNAELQIEVERLRGQAEALRATFETSKATVARLQHAGTLRRITAPVTGTLAEVSTVKAGAFLDQGDSVATIVPPGTIRVVARFLPAEAFGRVAVGQSARVRLDGFPFTQYGRLEAVVSSVDREVREGSVRVELTLTGASTTIPIQHGLPGIVEVEVEVVSPAALVLRAAGRQLSHNPVASPD